MGKVFNRFDRNELRKELKNHSTRAEIKLWLLLKKRKINGYKFRRQFSVGTYIVDFYCPKLKLAIEIDGDYHKEEFTRDYDKDRQDYVESFGISFLRLTNEEVLNNPMEVIDKIIAITKNLSPP
jgi:very-short-patch-repair endonuclease